MYADRARDAAPRHPGSALHDRGLRRPIIRCTPYVPFGTQALSDLILDHLGDRHGVLLGNHGMVATGATLEQAMWRAGELESLAKMYFLASSGAVPPVILSDDDIARTIERFADYGMTARSSETS